MLHYDMEFKKSDIANFAIVIPVKENRTVVFSDDKYSNVFDKPFTEESNDSVELLDMKGAREFSKMIQEIFKIETDTENFKHRKDLI